MLSGNLHTRAHFRKQSEKRKWYQNKYKKSSDAMVRVTGYMSIKRFKGITNSANQTTM